MFSQTALIAAYVLVATSISLLATPDWRGTLVAIGLQYFAVFWLVASVWPVGLAAIKLIVGLMAGAVLATSQGSSAEMTGLPPLSGRLFRTLAGFMVLLVVTSIAPILNTYLHINESVLLGGLILIGSGLLQLGMTTQPIRVVIGVLTFLAGFEIIYAALESSVLVAGLLAAVNLAMALAGAYLITAAAPEEQA